MHHGLNRWPLVAQCSVRLRFSHESPDQSSLLRLHLFGLGLLLVRLLCGWRLLCAEPQKQARLIDA